MEVERAILIVDDEAIILLSLRQEVQSILGPNFRYEIAMSAEEALRTCDALDAERVRLTLLISDWLMPGMKGDELIAKIRSARPEVGTIMISGQTDEDQLKKLKDSGALDAFLRKPWSAKRLAAECSRLAAPEAAT